MDKEKFNKLTIMDQVQYINDCLSKMSLTKACNSIGVNRSTISKRFNLNGYILKDNQYILTTTTTTPNTRANTSDSKDFDSRKMYYKLKVEIDLLQKRLDGLEKNINTNTIINTENKKDVKIFEGDEVVRSFRLNKELQRKWKSFCRANSDYRVSDLINNALDEYMNNFNKK